MVQRKNFENLFNLVKATRWPNLFSIYTVFTFTVLCYEARIIKLKMFADLTLIFTFTGNTIQKANLRSNTAASKLAFQNKLARLLTQYHNNKRQ